MFSDLTPAFKEAFDNHVVARDELYKTIGVSVNGSMEEKDRVYFHYNSDTNNALSAYPEILDLRGKEWSHSMNQGIRRDMMYVRTDTAKEFGISSITTFKIDENATWVNFGMRGLFFAIGSIVNESFSTLKLNTVTDSPTFSKYLLILSRQDRVYVAQNAAEIYDYERSEVEKRWDMLSNSIDIIKLIQVRGYERFVEEYPKEGEGLVSVDTFMKHLDEIIQGEEKYLTINERVNDTMRAQFVYAGKSNISGSIPPLEVFTYDFVHIYPERKDEEGK